MAGGGVQSRQESKPTPMKIALHPLPPPPAPPLGMPDCSLCRLEPNLYQNSESPFPATPGKVEQALLDAMRPAPRAGSPVNGAEATSNRRADRLAAEQGLAHTLLEKLKEAEDKARRAQGDDASRLGKQVYEVALGGLKVDERLAASGSEDPAEVESTMGRSVFSVPLTAVRAPAARSRMPLMLMTIAFSVGGAASKGFSDLLTGTSGPQRSLQELIKRVALFADVAVCTNQPSQAPRHPCHIPPRSLSQTSGRQTC